jgi:hypothetical protein
MVRQCSDFCRDEGWAALLRWFFCSSLQKREPKTVAPPYSRTQILNLIAPIGQLAQNSAGDQPELLMRGNCMPLVFVHGVANRQSPEQTAATAQRTALFQQIFLALPRLTSAIRIGDRMASSSRRTCRGFRFLDNSRRLPLARRLYVRRRAARSACPASPLRMRPKRSISWTSSGPNLTFRFAWGFLAGLACASLRNARAKEDPIERRQPLQA